MNNLKICSVAGGMNDVGSYFVVGGLGLFLVAICIWLVKWGFNNAMHKILGKFDDELKSWKEERKEMNQKFDDKWITHEKEDKEERIRLDQSINDLKNTLIKINNDLLGNFVKKEEYTSIADKNTNSHARLFERINEVKDAFTAFSATIKAEMGFYKTQIEEINKRQK